MIANTAPTPKAVALVLFPALVLTLAFAFSYVGAFHDPTPHNVPVAAVGPPTVAAELNDLPGDPLDARQASSRADALSQIDDREVYGAYDAAANRLFVAAAANRPTAIALKRTFNRAAAGQGQPAVSVTDVKPLPHKDPNGTAAFYTMIAWVFGGYIASTLIGLIGSPRSRSTQRAAARIGALAAFSIVAGILSVVLLRASFDVFSGHVVALCGIGALTIFASGAATAGIQASIGPAGTGLVILVFVILGNAASGGPSPGHCCQVCGGPSGASCRRARASTWRGRRCSSTGRGSRDRFSCWWDGRSPVRCSRSRSAAGSRTPSTPRQRPPREQRCEQATAVGQPRLAASAASDGAGSGRRIMRNEKNRPAIAVSRGTSKATWSASGLASSLIRRISS